jgi:hypothetical protein
MGKIEVDKPIEDLGQIADVHGVKWDIVSIWPNGEQVTACKTSEVSEAYSRWLPFDVMLVGEESI